MCGGTRDSRISLIFGDIITGTMSKRRTAAVCSSYSCAGACSVWQVRKMLLSCRELLDETHTENGLLVNTAVWLTARPFTLADLYSCRYYSVTALIWFQTRGNTGSRPCVGKWENFSLLLEVNRLLADSKGAVQHFLKRLYELCADSKIKRSMLH